MTSTLSFHGRLPGVDCSPALPAGEQRLRFDVAGFVGLAEKGPLDIPVPIEDAIEYAAVFGGDLVVAQDAGEPVHAQLPSAVRGFFDNGGRRCHVVRVAGPAAAPARWQVPGLEVWQPDGTAEPAVVVSAWPGSWSAGTSVQTALLAQHLSPDGDYTRRSGASDGVLPLARGATVGLLSGDVLRLDLGPVRPGLFVRVATVDAAASAVAVDLEIPFAAADVDAPAPGTIDALPPVVEVYDAQLVRFDLVVRQHTGGGGRLLDRMDELVLAPPAATRAAGPTPHVFWAEALQPADDDRPDRTRSMSLRQDVLTMTAMETGLAVPVGMAQPGAALDLSADPSGVAGLLEPGDDDLGSFESIPFADPLLAADSVFSVVPHAEQLTVLSSEPVRLKGMHALIGVDEVAVVTVPDATLRAWSPVVPIAPPPAPEPAPVEPVDWSDFRCCSDVPAEPPAPDEPPPPSTFEGMPALDRVADYDDSRLLDLQVSLVTMCAAMADRVAVLSVPRHYDVASTLAWRAQLASDGRVSDTTSLGASPLSYAGVWHPWMSVVTGQVGTRSVLRDVPPDGTVAGMIAARELARGAWIAPAGVPLRGVVRLAAPRPLTDDDEVRLFDAHANVLRRRPGVFTVVSSHTLSGDPRLVQLSVRRLLIVLRKICLQLGARYTFEVNNDRFRQLVRMRFDRILAALVDRGALHAFRVVTDGSVNTWEDQDAGRFVVVLQVAPTSPVEFITVTLLRTGEGLLDVLEG